MNDQFLSWTLKMLCSRLLVSVIALWLVTRGSGATLSSGEVQALRDVATTLNKTNWDFSVDPCNGTSGWVDPIQPLQDSVTCNCSFLNGTICHVTSIILKAQNLSGTLPTDLGRLPYLQNLDLTKNYLSGTIPSRWGSTKLVNISLLGNRLTGQLPKEIGNISTLASLTVEYNKLSGVLPQELGNLSSIRTLYLTSNNFTGQLPETLAKLTTLTDFRIGDNPFTGQIPEFIQNLTNLQRLIIQGTNLSGPIPTGIGLLRKMVDLRISDLTSGTESQFPPLNNMTSLNILILRSCNIVGSIPDYLGGLTSLELLLDLSFNKLTGGFPSNFIGISAIQYMYLTGNMLSGSVPDYIFQKGKEVDLSYNNFSSEATCQQGTINLFASSSMSNVSKIITCLQSYKCPKNYYSMNINCGGQAATIDGITYEGDTDPGGPSRFHQSNTNWAYSNTGNFIDDNIPVDLYIQTNTTPLSANASSLYTDARISPLSLSYYGFCLGNGNYTVHLHFAEIRFTGDKTYMSLGRRIFDVYIQRKLVLKDFNIEDEAGGVGQPVIKNFTAVVSSNTLEIRFYWAGKGTNAIPVKGVFGPLISAISVSSNFQTPSDGSSLSTADIVGIGIAAIAAVSLFLCIVWWKCYKRRKDAMDQDLMGLNLQTGSFTLRQIKAATKNFDPANKIGEGGFGSVYKGLLSDGTTIAVKQLSSKSKQGNREFVNEIGMISALHHPHLVKLYGCCIEGNQLLLVYEYMENNSLARALYGPEEYQLHLDWPTRQKICVGIARGLAFLHEESRLKIVHRDIKATNVLLDKNLNPKISDFGLAKLNEEDDTHISTRIAGTYGYMAPEYAMRGYLTNKADVYSFGVVALEIVSGKSNTSFRPKEEECFYLLDWALVLKERGKLLELVDPRLGVEYNQDEVIKMIEVALLCTNVSPAVRPLMSSVVSMLEGRTTVSQAAAAAVQSSNVPKHEIKVHMPDGPWTTSSTSNDDLYTISLDSDSLETHSLVKPDSSGSQV